MKRYVNLFVVLVTVVIIIVMLQEKGKNRITLQETVESFNEYNMVVEDFIEYPSKEKIAFVSKYARDFILNYLTVIDNQTFFNKLLRIEPIHNKDEIIYLEELYRKYERLNENYVSSALTNVFMATDFLVLINEAKEKGKFESESVDIRIWGENNFNIIIVGNFYADGSPNILTGYFIIETEHGNYYMKKPDNFSISITDTQATITADKTKYTFKGNIVY